MDIKTMKKEINKTATKYGATIEWLQKVDARHLYHYWYGGEVVSVSYKSIKFIISAIGDVKCDLYRLPNNKMFQDKFSTENELLATVKDKQNLGRFYDEMHYYLKSDLQLAKAIESNHLDVMDNNWWEISAVDAKGQWHDFGWCADGYSVFDAIEELFGDIENVYQEVARKGAV